MTKEIDWSKKRVLIGNVCIDSASITIGDKITKSMEFYTPYGDSSPAVYAQKINGRKCIVIDFDATIYDGVLKQVANEWVCPVCGEDELVSSTCSKESCFRCKNGHDGEVQHAVIYEGQ